MRLTRPHVHRPFEVRKREGRKGRGGEGKGRTGQKGRVEERKEGEKVGWKKESRGGT